MDADPQEVSWEADEYAPVERSADWFWVVGGVAAAGIILAFAFKNFLFALIILLATFSAMAYAVRPPERLRFVLNQRGLMVKNHLYPYERLVSFWVNADLPLPKLMLKSDRIFMPYLIIPLDGVDPAAVRAFLRPRLEEQAHHESAFEQIAEHLGF